MADVTAKPITKYQIAKDKRIRKELTRRYGEPQPDESIEAWQNPEKYFEKERFVNG